MKARILWMLKVCIAGIVAFAILNLLTCVYRGGLPSIADETMSTPVRHVPNSYYSDMTEGISIGFYDKNGFNNAYPENDTIDYLCLGSSNVEAKEVMPDKNFVYKLNELLNSDGKTGYAYNIGTSGERLPECINRLSYAVETYQPKKAIIIETNSLDFTQQQIDEALGDAEAGELSYSFDGKIMGFIRKLPFVRLAYTQIQAMESKNEKEEINANEKNALDVFDSALYIEKITPLLKKADEDANGLPVVIFYHPGITIHSDGSINTNGESAMIREFRKICEANHVYFLDMSERFVREYKESYTVPYGFANSHIGSGHLNQYGHTMIADELHKLLKEVE